MSSIGNMVSNTVMGIIAAVVFVAVGFALGPTVTDTALGLHADNLTGVPLSSVLLLLSTYIPAFYYLGVCIGGIIMVWAVVRSRN